MNRENTCKACEGTGMLADDEGWQYSCSVCDGDGEYSESDASRPARVRSVDENNRLLD
ncbi:DnaJ-class molecular chaperone [Virgibacillus natechei]|uniref:DnaJ-class molecular chaperone n=1 Tax=Virgibacillus natechei TaxID=1216297 RepID=A0ABS4IBX2_9BACI|nr:hypothetical protein [Virgibacillus natechei]MBP1968434.1 DnaJ-class molecular chaperone [Virgibacillus natechei]UZD13557.1 hypothetical protein OLD84_03085 [Virgibacillus natechei]